MYLVLTGGRFLKNCEFVNFVNILCLQTEQIYVLGVQEYYHTETLAELGTTCKQNASCQITQDNETIFPIWQKESWQTSEETSRYV